MKHQLKGSEKAERKEVEKEEEEKEEKSEAKKKSLVDKAQSTIGGKERRRGERKRGETIFWEDLEDGSFFL